MISELRVVRLEGEAWHIRSRKGVLSLAEQAELREYFSEIRLPFVVIDGCLCIPGSVDRAAVFESLSFFYDGHAEVALR